MCDLFIDIMPSLDGMDLMDYDLLVANDENNMNITVEDTLTD